MHESLADHVAELIGVVGDDLDHLVEVLQDAVGDLGPLDHDDVVKLVGAILTGAAGAATRHYLAAPTRRSASVGG